MAKLVFTADKGDESECGLTVRPAEGGVVGLALETGGATTVVLDQYEEAQLLAFLQKRAVGRAK